MWNPLHKNDQHITAEIAKYGISHHHLRALNKKKLGVPPMKNLITLSSNMAYSGRSHKIYS